MRVRATERGFFDNHLVEIDEEFDVTKPQFSERWMEKVTAAEKSAEETTPGPAKAETG